ncbi:unnamed protein product [Cylicocyclus nassatus]|uniref:Uncharacterized protein n=1 Tax=Cylicocyclus nassatus TaxID=53992 RepID=A0AA36DQC8_CYLNA|nr:unnamed protein product [Cylicocyclus nassatus]
MLSACFLLKTVVFNIDMGYGAWQQLIVKLTSNINYSKWALYALGNPVISHAILHFNNVTPVRTVSTLVTKL